jgi:uncharacterized protein (DUF1778 family)
MVKRKTYEKIAREWDEAIESGAIDDELRPVKVEAAKEPRAVVAVRMSASEFSTVTQAAESRDLNFSQFMREAALAAAAGKLDLRAGEVRRIKEQIRELAETVNHL